MQRVRRKNGRNAYLSPYNIFKQLEETLAFAPGFYRAKRAGQFPPAARQRAEASVLRLVAALGTDIPRICSLQLHFLQKRCGVMIHP